MGKVGEGPGTLWCGQIPRLVGKLSQHGGIHRPWELPALSGLEPQPARGFWVQMPLRNQGTQMCEFIEVQPH